MSTWTLDASHTTILFTAKHLMFAKVRGVFGVFSGELQYDPALFQRASLQVSVQASSVSTHEARRDGHLQGPEFFDVAQHPTITFQSTRIEGTDLGDLRVVGDLTIRGVRREVVLKTEVAAKPVQDHFGRTRLAASAATVIDRKAFGMTWNKDLDAGGVVLGDEISLTIDAEFIKQA